MVMHFVKNEKMLDYPIIWKNSIKMFLTEVGLLLLIWILRLGQMLSLVEDNNSNTILDMHLIHIFDDSSSENAYLANKSSAKLDIYILIFFVC